MLKALGKYMENCYAVIAWWRQKETLFNGYFKQCVKVQIAEG